MATLCLLGEDGSIGMRWEIGAQPLAVGRDQGADIRINDEALSRRHFLIQRKGDSYFVEDLNSQNGTWVSGKRAPSAKLTNHDCILAGRTLFLFTEKHFPAAEPATTDNQPA